MHVNYLSASCCLDVLQYNQTEDIAMGSFNFAYDNDTMPLPQMCLQYYRVGEIFAFNESYIFNPNDIVNGRFLLEASIKFLSHDLLSLSVTVYRWCVI